MKKTTQLFKTCLASLLLIGAVAKSNADVTFTVDSGATWNGYMNWFDVAGTGYGMAAAGAYAGGSVWATADLRASFSGPTLSLQANTIGDANPYWYTPSGGPGAVGNKIMDANFYQEYGGGLGNVTFQGNVLANSLVGPTDGGGRGWTAVAFIKDFAPDFSSSVSTTVPLSPGYFNFSLATIANGARHIQVGFEVIGPDVWAGDPLSLPSITIVPEPTSIALAGLGAVLFAIRRRK